MKKFKPFLIIQLRAEDAAADNELEAILEAGKLSENDIERLRGEQNGIKDINIDKYSGIIVGGSPFDISTPEDDKSETQKIVEKDFLQFLDDVIKNDFPFLGACSGCGQIGNYCGVPITKKYGEPVGGVDIRLTEEGKKDKLLEGFPETFRALGGHKEACERLPDGAALLASTKDCPIHMYRLGENVYATQFHPELDRDGIILRINVYKNAGYFPPEEADALIERMKDEHVELPKKIIKNFVSIYRRPY